MQIVAGKSFTCGIDIDQRVTCWGLLAAEVPGLYEQITAAKNGHFACGIMTNQRLNCWGEQFSLLYEALGHPHVVAPICYIVVLQ